MNLLLDTHTFLWWDDEVLDARVVAKIQSAERVFVSAAVAWEIAIKASMGRLETRSSVAAAIADYAFTELPIRIEHADAVRTLPRHHGDPFDRILVAQATVDDLVLCTKDPIFAKYGVRTAWT